MTKAFLRLVRGRIGAVALCAIQLGGCNDTASRRPVPTDLVDKVHVPGYGAIRFWGDINTAAFDAAMTKQFEDLRRAAADGKMPGADSKANILSVSGGGDKGAFAAGYLKGWSDRGTRPIFDTVTGVSTGALAAPFAFLGPSHDHDMQEIYTENGASQLYTARWDFGVFGNAVKDTKPLRQLIEHYATGAFLDQIAAQYRLGRRLLVSTTNVDAERPVIWDLSAIAASGRPDRRKLFVDILLATSAVPGIFPPVEIRTVGPDGKTYDELHADGSVSMQMFFLPPGIKLAEAEQKVFGRTRARSLYVLRNGKLFPEYGSVADKAISLAQRGLATLVKYQVVYNLRLLKAAADESQTRFQFMGIPRSFEAKGDGEFDVGYAQKLFAAGRMSGSKEEWRVAVPETPELVR